MDLAEREVYVHVNRTGIQNQIVLRRIALMAMLLYLKRILLIRPTPQWSALMLGLVTAKREFASVRLNLRDKPVNDWHVPMIAATGVAA